MKKTLFVFVLSLFTTLVLAQEKVHAKKLTREEEAQLTAEQRLAHETERKSKGGKRKVSTKEKARIQKRQVKRAERVKPPRQPKRKS
jgi:hypothetical protein